MCKMDEADFKKWRRDFKKRVGTTRECAGCGAQRLYGHGCTHCKAMGFDMLELGDAFRIAFDKMTPEERTAMKKRTRSSVIWDKENPTRPYHSESIN